MCLLAALLEFGKTFTWGGVTYTETLGGHHESRDGDWL